MVKKSSSDEPIDKKRERSKDIVRDISFNALVAALYFALTVCFQPISFGAIQFRVSEVLVLLCFWRKDLIIGLTIGCLLSNVFSFSAWDILLGSGATLISCLFIVYLSPRFFVAPLWPVLFNGLIIGAELTWIYPAFPEFWQNAISVAGGELVIMVVGYFLWFLVVKNEGFRKLLRPNAHPSILY